MAQHVRPPYRRVPLPACQLSFTCAVLCFSGKYTVYAQLSERDDFLFTCLPIHNTGGHFSKLGYAWHEKG
jgi:hypothetical protein